MKKKNKVDIHYNTRKIAKITELNTSFNIHQRSADVALGEFYGFITRSAKWTPE
jgi:hypothetical protein